MCLASASTHMKPTHSVHSFALRAARYYAIRSLAIVALFLPVSLVAQTQTNAPPPPPTRPATQIPAPSMPHNPSVVITLDQAIDFARHNNPELQAQRTLVYQSREQEVTANLRPNPTLSWDGQYLPLFEPHLFSSDYIDDTAQFDAGISYLFERGKKRQNRLLAAKGVTAVTEAQVADAERTTISQTAQQFVTALACQVEPGLHGAPARQLSAHCNPQPTAAEERQDDHRRPAEDPAAGAAVPERRYQRPHSPGTGP